MGGNYSALFFFQVKELPTYKDADFLNYMQKIYVSDEEKEKLMDKLSRDTEVRELCFLCLIYVKDFCSNAHRCSF